MSLFKSELVAVNMQYEEVLAIVRPILIRHFDIPQDQFSLEIPLDVLQENFQMLSYLMFLEQLLQQQFGEKIQLLEYISTAFHTPEDIIQIIMKQS